MCVDNSIKENVDPVYIKKFLDEGQVQPLRENPTYEDQVGFIRAVQHAVLHSVPHKRPLPYGKPREPKDIYEAKGQYGACCDKSRLIEKILRRHGLKTRHVFMCSIKGFGCKLKTWLSKDVVNHAVSEVLTKKGWLVVDSEVEWVSLDKQNRPYSMKKIRCEKRISWKKPMCSCSEMKKICDKPLTFLYGLYSRSGRLYPPFWFCFPLTSTDTEIKFCFPFPDINCDEFLYNCPRLKKVIVKIRVKVRDVYKIMTFFQENW